MTAYSGVENIESLTRKNRMKTGAYPIDEICFQFVLREPPRKKSPEEEIIMGMIGQVAKRHNVKILSNNREFDYKGTDKDVADFELELAYLMGLEE